MTHSQHSQQMNNYNQWTATETSELVFMHLFKNEYQFRHVYKRIYKYFWMKYNFGII